MLQICAHFAHKRVRSSAVESAHPGSKIVDFPGVYADVEWAKGPRLEFESHAIFMGWLPGCCPGLRRRLSRACRIDPPHD